MQFPTNWDIVLLLVSSHTILGVEYVTRYLTRRREAENSQVSNRKSKWHNSVIQAQLPSSILLYPVQLCSLEILDLILLMVKIGRASIDNIAASTQDLVY